ncbi:MAG: type III effector [Gammaproteobacteria bacterium]|nr:type III effector [Gammaproteobacteria bacterium]
MNDLDEFLKQITTTPEKIEFNDVINIIAKHYLYTPSRFVNGTDSENIINAAGENEGSCKIFSFAQLHQLDKEQTLNCFGQYYREDVLKHPEGSDHANIRTFIKHGWQQIKFDETALKRKQE